MKFNQRKESGFTFFFDRMFNLRLNMPGRKWWLPTGWMNDVWSDAQKMYIYKIYYHIKYLNIHYYSI